MRKRHTFSVRVSKPLKEKVEALAQILERPRSWVVTKALETYVDQEAEQISAVQKALKETDQGKSLIDHGRVDRWLQAWGCISIKKDDPK